MDDPLLSSLCGICRIHVPKYTCPRCSVETCSLPCSRRHKIWSSCSGIRDPTIYRPMNELATPSGIDHDYNFLHSIEHQIERSEKRIIDDRGLVEKAELVAARNNVEPDIWRAKMLKRKRQIPGHAPIEDTLKRMRTTVDLAPKGMSRSMENNTTWARRQKIINWQVEWIREGDAGRSLSKVMGNMPIRQAYVEYLELERLGNLSDKERALENKASKRKAKLEDRERLARDAVLAQVNLSTSSTLQNPQTGAWNLSSAFTVTRVIPTMAESKPPHTNYNLYLVRPKTPSSFPQVLTPINSTKTLDRLLQNRLVVEFPSIYVLKDATKSLPAEFMLEKDFLSATKQPPLLDSDADLEESDEDSDEDSNDEAAISDTSSSGSDTDEDVEDGESPE